MNIWVREICLYTMAEFTGVLAYSEGAKEALVSLAKWTVRDF